MLPGIRDSVAAETQKPSFSPLVSCRKKNITSAMELRIPLFVLLFQVRSSMSQVAQTPASQQILEGDLFTINCSNPNAFQPFFWYYQLPGSAPSLWLSMTTKANETKGHFTAERSADGKRSLLHISGAQLGDSGIYLCASDAQ
ncbi:UNVERIFIED_CONTAM: hypothetical protein K2H54_045039 [Gekko kuhli]